ncbi:hypothetical protein SDC9_160341 [bioreactor metagenome]|uniref:Uncharacterized protein n=1 Tax=bioreactor metagenome TaxID=1076179 RepID=A0A645FF78_9ZZZZ
MMAIPIAANFRMEAKSISASDSVNTAVGSSRTRSWVFSLSISLAISVNCLCPTGISETRVSESITTLSFSIAVFPRSSISSVLRVRRRSPKDSTRTLYCVGSLFNTIFSAAVKPGIKENSWCTIPIPASRASRGFLN